MGVRDLNVENSAEVRRKEARARWGHKQWVAGLADQTKNDNL